MFFLITYNQKRYDKCPIILYFESKYKNNKIKHCFQAHGKGIQLHETKAKSFIKKWNEWDFIKV